MENTNICEMVDIEGMAERQAQVLADQFCEDFEINDKASKFEVLNAFRDLYRKMAEDTLKFASNWFESHSDELDATLSKFMD